MNWRRQFLENEQRLISTLGDWVPPCNDRLLEGAERLVRREILRDADGQWRPADLTQLDWSGESAPNPYVGHVTLMQLRMLIPLAAAYRATGDERFAQSAREYIEAFFDVHPMTDPWTPVSYDGPTSFPGRIGVTRQAGWLGTLSAFEGSKAFDDDFFMRIIDASRCMLAYLSNHVYPGRNIRILHGDMLLLNGLRLAFLPEAEAWREKGVHILNDAVNRQLLPGGADMEGAPEYHCDVMYVLTPLWKLAQAYPELSLHISNEKLAGMFDYALAVTRPDGALTSMNDTSYMPPRGDFHHHVLHHRHEFFQDAGLPEEMPPTCRHFADVGQIFLRDNWGPDATYITFDATTRHGWHWHPSRNAIQLFANRRALLIDPGYPFHNSNWPAYGNSTAHHSTLNLNGFDQSHVGAWARLRQAPGYDLAEGLYGGGYWPTKGNTHGAGVFGEHHRALLWIRGRCVVVFDQLMTMPEPGEEMTIESVWQLSEGDVELRDEGRAAVTCHPDSNLLLLFPLMTEGMQATVHKGEREPVMRGWVPGNMHVNYTPAPMVRLHARECEPAKCHLATVLIPFTGTEAPAVRVSALRPGIDFADRTPGQLDIYWPDGSRDFLLWTGRIEEAIDTYRDIDTDAALLHLQFDADGQFIKGLTVDATYLKCDKVDMERVVRM